MVVLLIRVREVTTCPLGLAYGVLKFSSIDNNNLVHYNHK